MGRKGLVVVERWEGLVGALWGWGHIEGPQGLGGVRHWVVWGGPGGHGDPRVGAGGVGGHWGGMGVSGWCWRGWEATEQV